MSKEEYKGAIEVSVIFHEGQRMFAVPKQVAQQEPVKDHGVAALVNRLRDIAVAFHATEQLRDRIAHEISCVITPPQPAQQEPVAWYRDEDGIRIYYESKVWDDATPLYTSPPAQRKENT